MSLSEFQLIEKYFSSPFTGDDGAVVKVPKGMSRIGVFESATASTPNINTDHPRALAHRVLSTALNKLAAIGANPAWMTLSLTLPQARESWLQPFSEGLLNLARRFNISLIGGDTTQGPLTITVMLDGLVKRGAPLTRLPQLEDRLYVSGFLASTANALLTTSAPHMFSDGERRRALAALDYPEPRTEIGINLRDISTATADLTGGLVHGIETLLGDSDLGAEVVLEKLPVPPAVINQMALAPTYRPWLSFPGDHELVFSVPGSSQQHLQARFRELSVPVTMIGKIDSKMGLRLVETS